MSISEKYPHKVSSDTLSVASRTTSDYFPRSYKRPAPYLLWDDNIVPIHIASTSSTSSSSSSDFSVCRLLLTILIILAAIGVVVVIAAAVYLGVLTSDLMDEVTNEQSFDGRLRITDGDKFVPELANSSSLEFQLKVKRYETMLNVLLRESPLKDGFKETEVLGFRMGSLMVFFRVHLDRRKVQLKSTHDMAVAIHKIIIDDASKKFPRALKDITVDVDSISVWDLLYKKKAPAREVFKASTRRTLPPTELPRIIPETSPLDLETTLPTTTSEVTEAIETTPEDELVTSTGVFEPVDVDEVASTTASEVLEAETTAPEPVLVVNKSDVVYGPWTPLVPAVHESHVNSDVLKSILNPVTLRTTATTSARFSSWRPLRRPEALTSGVASEIPFLLGDFLAYEAGFRDQAKSASSASEQYSTAVRPETPNFPMETNVAAVLLLRNSPQSSERNGSNVLFSSPGQGGTSPLSPIAAILPPWRWRDRVTSSGIGGSSTRRKLRQRPSFLTSTMKSVVELSGGDLRVTSPTVVQDGSLRIVTSNTHPPNSFISGVAETVIQSTNFLVKSPKKLNSDPAENDHQQQHEHQSTATQDWIPVAALNWRTDKIGTTSSDVVETSTEIPPPPASSFLEEQTVYSTSIDQKEGPPTTLERDIETSFHSADISLKDVASEVNVCPKPGNFRCKSGGCVSHSSRCNQMRDCSDNSDEDGCTCADYLYAQFLSEKICDGVVDCWDYSDENRCSQCSPEMFVCPNSNMCIEHDKLCDATVDCPGGEDEKQCVRVAANETLADDGHYYRSGYLMVRKNGKWGHLCVENFSRFGLRASSSTLGLTQLASAVCQTLTFSDYVSVERKKVPLTPRTYDHRSDSFYRLALQPSKAVRNILEFNQTSCRSRDVIWMQCKNLECGVRPMAPAPTARIVGGSNALAGSWPWQVAMYKSGEYMCGATLINDRWLLSAAHCFYNEIDNYWTARLGMLRRGSQAPHEQIHIVSHIVIHPHYVKVGFVNDVALLRIQTPATFSDFVRPVCLPTTADESVFEGRMCTVVGWGQLLETGHVFPDTLQEVELPIFTSQECRKKTVFLQTYQITENMFCAGYDRGGRDACLGDSGGPLVCQHASSGKWSLVGITSNGFGCARAWRPGIYTKVANYVDWINQVMDSPLRAPIRSHCRGHRCRLGKCLLAISICNGYVECADGSDERGCPT